MFRKMRRNKQSLTNQNIIQILNENTSGVLAVSGDDGYPYAVPLSYVYSDDKIFFHCAVEGHKLDAIRLNDKASFCVINCDDVLPDKYTVSYQSVIVFGRAHIIRDKKEIKNALILLAQKYNKSASLNEINLTIESGIERLCVIGLNIEYMTGKQGIEFLKND